MRKIASRRVRCLIVLNLLENKRFDSPLGGGYGYPAEGGDCTIRDGQAFVQKETNRTQPWNPGKTGSRSAGVEGAWVWIREFERGGRVDLDWAGGVKPERKDSACPLFLLNQPESSPLILNGLVRNIFP